MTSNKTFLSWWSYGFIRFHVLALIRTRESERYIVGNTQGSDHGKRKYRKSQKIKFLSDIVYGTEDLSLKNRWGGNFISILDLCDSTTRIPKRWRRGFDKVMGNFVFYHSVPNNIPGMLFCNHRGWNPLFIGRAVPEWLETFFRNQENNNENESIDISYSHTSIPYELIQVLLLIKSGVRNIHSLALRLDCSSQTGLSIIQTGINAGLISENKRLTDAGTDLVVEYKKTRPERKFDYSLYVPQSWCTDRETVQPFTQMEATSDEWTDLIESNSIGGEAGQDSLERTDAKADEPPKNFITKAYRRLGMVMKLLAPRGLKVK